MSTEATIPMMRIKALPPHKNKANDDDTDNEILKNLQRDRPKKPVTLLDPYAWIVLQLPKHLWTRGKRFLDEIDNYVEWNVLTGEISILANDFGEDSKTIRGSNIVDILRHALEEGPLEPVGYEKIYRFLPPTSPLPVNKTPDSDLSKGEESSKVKKKISKLTSSVSKIKAKKQERQQQPYLKPKTASKEKQNNIKWITLKK